MEVSKKVSGILLDDRDLDGVVGGIDVSSVKNVQTMYFPAADDHNGINGKELTDKWENKLRQEETGTGTVITGEMSPPFDW